MISCHSKLIGSIAKQGTARISKALWEASKGKVGTAVSGMKGYAKETGNSILSKVGLRRSQEALSTEIQANTATSADLSNPEAGGAEPEDTGPSCPKGKLRED